MRRILLLFTVFSIFFMIISGNVNAVCPDGSCEPSESCYDCHEDCGICPNILSVSTDPEVVFPGFDDMDIHVITKKYGTHFQKIRIDVYKGDTRELIPGFYKENNFSNCNPIPCESFIQQNYTIAEMETLEAGSYMVIVKLLDNGVEMDQAKAFFTVVGFRSVNIDELPWWLGALTVLVVLALLRRY